MEEQEQSFGLVLPQRPQSTHSNLSTDSLPILHEEYTHNVIGEAVVGLSLNDPRRVKAPAEYNGPERTDELTCSSFSSIFRSWHELFARYKGPTR